MDALKVLSPPLPRRHYAWYSACSTVHYSSNHDTAMNPVERFLVKTAGAIKSGFGSLRRVTISMGNEAADTDSTVSALLYAYLYGHMNADRVCIPIVGVPREDLRLRTEVVAFLDGLVDSSLMFYSDTLKEAEPFLINNSETAGGDWQLVLTDHNEVAPSLTHLQPAVTGILDHHADSGLSPHASPRILQVVGSATTLVVQHFKEYIASQLSAEERAIVGRLALGPITFDTSNYSESSARATPRDHEAARLCWSWMRPEQAAQVLSVGAQTAATGEDKPEDMTNYTQDLYKRMNKAHKKIHHLSSADLLRKDYKEYEETDAQGTRFRYGISSVAWKFDGWLAREGGKTDDTPGDVALGKQKLAESMREHARQRNLHYLLVLTASSTHANGCFGRELGGLASEEFWRRLSSESQMEMAVREDLSDLSSPNGMRIYDVKNTKMSRKLTQPIVHGILQDMVHDCAAHL